MSTRLYQYLFSVAVLGDDRTAAFFGVGGRERRATDEQDTEIQPVLFPMLRETVSLQNTFLLKKITHLSKFIG